MSALREIQTIQTALKKLRLYFPEKSDLDILVGIANRVALTPEALLKYAKGKKRFSTSDVMRHFQVDKYKAAGSIAVLSERETLVADSPKKTADGSSRWRYTGRRR